MNTTIFRNIFLAMLLMATPTQAGTIDMTTQTETIETEQEIIGVNISNSYYTVVMEDNQVKKIELNGQEQPDIEVHTTWKEVWHFVVNYEDMSWLDKAKYLIKNFDIPVNRVMDIG